MSEFTVEPANPIIESQLGPNIDGKGNFLIVTGGKILSMNYVPKGDGLVLCGLEGQPINRNVPKDGWFRFADGVHKVSFSFPAGDGLENDIMLQWNLS